MRRLVINVLSLGALGALGLSVLLHAAPSSLAEAAMQGDTDTVRGLLKSGTDVNSAQADGMTALHWAALKDDVDLARILLFAGANVRATTRLGGYTPLLMASKNGNVGMIDALVKAGADPDGATTNGTTALMLAAASGKAEAVTVLLDHGADIDARETRGETALIFAAAYGRADAIRALTAYGADVSVTTKTVDLSVYTKEQQERFAAFAATGAPPNSGVRPAGPGPAGADAKPADGKEPAPPAEPVAAGRGGRGGAGRGGAPQKPQIGGVDRQFLLNELVGGQGGLTPLLVAARQGQLESVDALLDAGADVNQPSEGDKTTPLLIATINGRFDLAKVLLGRGADPKAASENGVTPLYAALNCQWAPKALYPQPRAYEQQATTYLDLMTALLDKGANPNVRLKKKVWYSGYNFDLSGVDESGATPFWRAAYASDVDAMRLLAARGADPNIPTMRTPGRPRTGDAQRDVKDVSPLPPVPVGGPAVTPLQAAAGVGYGEGFAANSHRFAPGGMLAAVKYLIEELHMDVNATDQDGNTALHHAAARGDNEMILYLVSKGASVQAVNREGKTTVDMANGPVQRTQPFPETIALLEKLGARNNHKCVSC
jgi:ankyrin repeat protein